jgi:ABC-2 type transport system ATP-binding protein
MALMGKPELIILDEPTNGLDPAGINEIRNLVKSIPEKYGSTVIISSHLLSEVEQMADYVGIINKGKMIYQGLLSELEIEDASLEEVFLEMTKGA